MQKSYNVKSDFQGRFVTNLLDSQNSVLGDSKKHLPVFLFFERYNFWVTNPMPKPEKLFLDIFVLIVILIF